MSIPPAARRGDCAGLAEGAAHALAVTEADGPGDAFDRFRLDRKSTKEHDDVRGLPEPRLPIARRLQAENPLVPVGIMRETNVLDLEIGLSLFPFYRPREMGFVELLAQFGNFNRIGSRKQNYK
jgi:hypothetical protein